MTQLQVRRVSTSGEDWEWETRALCFQPTEDPDLWWSTDQSGKEMARHKCLVHCPVLEKCIIYYAVSGGETAGGISYKQNCLPMKQQPKIARSCNLCARNVDTPPRG